MLLLFEHRARTTKRRLIIIAFIVPHLRRVILFSLFFVPFDLDDDDATHTEVCARSKELPHVVDAMIVSINRAINTACVCEIKEREKESARNDDSFSKK